ncbi:MAG: site-specific integrase [Phycisphaerae bacterium]|nr:site-specific integrase [Phycisphaerae bacterium]
MSTQVQNLNTKLAEQSLGKIVKAFLDYLNIEAGLSENTILGYGRDLRDFAEFCFAKNIKKPGDIDNETLFGYAKSLARKNKAEASINRSVVAIKMFMRFCGKSCR